ncbi:MAG: N-formylglutamate amidohydrolase [Rhodobacteraceae bacterium]|nr:N-formylglutamate amidohydrolase [Paracoccaceae bacterium]
MNEQSAYEALNNGASSRVLILCDHASNHVPADVNGGDLGISKADMNRHIAYDIGARGTALALAKALKAPMLASRFSRLVIDPNRGEDDPTILMKIYDHTIIKGNRHADAKEKQRRIESYHRPYHAAIKAALAKTITRGEVPVIISIHSYTPQLNGRPKRPWHIGVLWGKDGRMALPLIEKLAENPDITVGDNEPYSGELHGDTMYFHATRKSYPHVLIELRHDLIDTPEGEQKWAAILARPLQNIIAKL